MTDACGNSYKPIVDFQTDKIESIKDAAWVLSVLIEGWPEDRPLKDETRRCIALAKEHLDQAVLLAEKGILA